VTLERVREKVDSGYENLLSRLAALDYDAEQLAEEELAGIFQLIKHFSALYWTVIL